jgi:hypothetical protein
VRTNLIWLGIGLCVHFWADLLLLIVC